MPRTCLVVGVGLIGGSLGLALGQNPNFRVLGADPDEKALAQALQLGAIAERL
jgi:prephenate dehydrogenase